MKPSEQSHADAVAAGYDRGAAVYARVWNAPHPWMEEARRQFAGRLKPGASVLDVGCGPGHESMQTVRPIAGLKDENGGQIEVPYMIWSEADLAHLLGERFAVEWSKSDSPLPGAPRVWSGVLRKK